MTTVLVDLDGIVADLHNPWVGWINDTFYPGSFGFSVEDITKYKIEDCVEPRIGRAIYGFLEGCYTSLPPLPGALEALEWLHHAGFEIIIVSAPAHSARTAADKLVWIRHHLPWLKRQDIFLGHRKEMLKADVIIDDSPDILNKYRLAWPYARCITIDWPFNREVTVHCRALDYRDTTKAWQQIVEFLTTGSSA